MSGFAADIVGLVGSALFIAGFAYANIVPDLDKRCFNAVNLVGSILLLVSLSVHFNLAAMVLESAWGLIALAGLVAALRRPAAGRP
ncbi:CBU_0592 family membrane protein [Sphingomonas sp.]|uniref:CBU_0592 family membrane protein n=1 Tax=Sphingomonas sp. TaxID=28214 RepID=UPI003AFFD839